MICVYTRMQCVCACVALIGSPLCSANKILVYKQRNKVRCFHSGETIYSVCVCLHEEETKSLNKH